MQAACFNEEAGFGFTPCSYLKAIEKCKSWFIFTVLCDETHTLKQRDKFLDLAQTNKQTNLTTDTVCLKLLQIPEKKN